MEHFGMGKIAIITGASRGIGRGIALDLSERGFSIAVNYAHNETEAASVVDMIAAKGGKAVAIKADVSDPSSGSKIFDETEQSLGQADILINNAGALFVRPIAEMPRDEFDKVLAITVGGTFTTMKEAATRLRAGGRVINFSSTSLYLALPGYAAYNAAKAAVEAMTKVLSKEFAGRNITVNTVAPGPVATELFYTGKTPETVERMARLSPLGRLGQVDDVVPVVRFLCHPDSSWVSGQTIRVNGAVG